jgi:hypothetical protein
VSNPELDDLLGNYKQGVTMNLLLVSPRSIFSEYLPPEGNGAGFQTFSLRYNDQFVLPTWNAAGVSDRAVSGGAQSDGGDPISIGTAWLYSQFAAGALEGYSYTPGLGRMQSASALQSAIWWLEEETGGNPSSPFVTLAVNALGLDAASLKSDANGAFNVRALNLESGGTTQNMLMTVAVPEPSTVIAGCLLLLPFAFRVLRRNVRQVQG